MCAGDDCIDDPEFLPATDPSCRNIVSGSYDTITGAGGFESAHDDCAYSDDMAAVGTRRVDRRCGLHRDRIRLVL